MTTAAERAALAKLEAAQAKKDSARRRTESGREQSSIQSQNETDRLNVLSLLADQLDKARRDAADIHSGLQSALDAGHLKRAHTSAADADKADALVAELEAKMATIALAEAPTDKVVGGVNWQKMAPSDEGRQAAEQLATLTGRERQVAWEDILAGKAPVVQSEDEAPTGQKQAVVPTATASPTPAATPAKPLASSGIGGSGGGTRTIVNTTPSTPPVDNSKTAFSLLGSDDLSTAFGWASALNDYKVMDAKGKTLADILNEATAKKWAPDTTNARVQEWLRTSGVAQSQAQWEAEKRLKPVDAQAKLDSLIAGYKEKAHTAGFNVDPARLKQLAEHAVAFNLSVDDQTRALQSEYHYNPSAAFGTSATQAARLKALAKSYLVPISDQAIGDWEQKIASGLDTEDSFSQYLRDQSKGMFPALAGMIDAGHTVSTLLDPYAQTAQTELGVTNVDWADPKWMGPLMQTDPKTGTRIMPTLDQWRTTLRTDPKYGWSTSVNGRNQEADFASQLRNLQAVAS